MFLNKRLISSLLILFLPFLMAAARRPADDEGDKHEIPAEARNPGADLIAAIGRSEDLMQGIDGIPRVPLGPMRDFVSGYALYRNGKWAAADERLRKSADKLQAIGDYILFYRARIANELGRYSEAASFLDVLSAKYPDSVWKDDANFELARAMTGLGHYSEAARRIRSYKKNAKNHELFEADLLYARLFIEWRDGAKAIRHVKDLALHASCEDELSELSPVVDQVRTAFKFDVDEWLRHPSNQYSLAESFSEHSEWLQAARRLEILLKNGRGLSQELSIKAKWLLAKAYRWTHRYDKSIVLMKDLQRTKGAQIYAPALPAMLATVYAKKDDYEMAIAIRNKMLTKYSRSSRIAGNVAYQIAYLYMDEGKYDEALRSWKNVLSMGLRSKKRILAKWNLAWCHYMMENYDGALESINSLLKRDASRGGIEDRATYWKGRVLIKLGREAEAKSSFRKILKDFPNGYYAVLAERRLKRDIRNVTDFVNYRGGKAKNFGWRPDDVSAGNSVHMMKAQFFDGLGLHEEVVRELSAIDKRDHPEFIDYMMWLASKNFGHDLAFRLAKGKYRHALKGDPSTDKLEHFVWQQYYPEAYGPVVAYFAKAGGIDPVLVWSIMRNESAFRPTVVSPAGAVGLMQLMPTTASSMMRELGGKPIDRRELIKPSVNIPLGTAYLSKLTGILPRNGVAVIASYNAGEEAVLRWIGNGYLNDIEEWIEEIPYSETNLYVKKVLMSYWGYKKLYGKE